MNVIRSSCLISTLQASYKFGNFPATWVVNFSISPSSFIASWLIALYSQEWVSEWVSGSEARRFAWGLEETFYLFKFTPERRHKMKITVYARRPSSAQDKRKNVSESWRVGTATGTQASQSVKASPAGAGIIWEPIGREADGPTGQWLGRRGGPLVKGRRWERWRWPGHPLGGGGGGGGVCPHGESPGCCSFSFCWGLGRGHGKSGRVKRSSTWNGSTRCRSPTRVRRRGRGGRAPGGLRDPSLSVEAGAAKGFVTRGSWRRRVGAPGDSRCVREPRIQRAGVSFLSPHPSELVLEVSSRSKQGSRMPPAPGVDEG